MFVVNLDFFALQLVVDVLDLVLVAYLAVLLQQTKVPNLSDGYIAIII